MPNSLVEHETRKSKLERLYEDWDPDWIEYTFVAWARCRNPNCEQNLAICGRGGVEPDYDEEGQTWSDRFYPTCCRPMPRIIDIPAKCPDDVTLNLDASFSLFWADRAACTSRIRSALECVLTHQGVPTTAQGVGSNGKSKELSLHARIEKFAAGSPVIGPQLMALKWLGNAGSHGTDVKRDDLLDAYEILEHCLVELIEQRSAKVAALAQKLTKKHGPK